MLRLHSLRSLNFTIYNLKFSNLSKRNNLRKNKILFVSLQHEFQISTYQNLFKIHSTKGWKTIAMTGHKPKAKASVDQIPSACEEGREAVNHSNLIDQLKKCDSISSQVQKFCSIISLSEDEMKRRVLFCHSLEEVFKLYFRDFKLQQFGSSVNGLGFKGCDMDVCFQTLFNGEEHVMLKDVPTLDSVTEGITTQETLCHMNPMFMLRFIRRILRRHCEDIKEPILFIKARCPILRFYNAKYDVFCDFSCESEPSLRNTRLIKLVCHLDERFMVLAKIIRYWGKYGGFVADIDKFNSYSFSLLVIYFLQNTDPPVLPQIKEMIEKSNYLKYADVNDVTLINQDLKNFQPSENSKSIDKLLKEFFFFYLNFDFERVLQPYSGSSSTKDNLLLELSKENFLPKNENSELSDKKIEPLFPFKTINTQDPFSPNFNTTGSANFKSCSLFLRSIVEICDLWTDNDTFLQPGKEIWGLCSLFKPPVNDSQQVKPIKRNHQIKLQIKPDASMKLKRIFEYGLLFKCKEFNVNDVGNNNSKLIFKMQCRTHKNTWQGRDLVTKNFINSNKETLEMEHLVSEEMLKNKMDGNKEQLCEIMCECREVVFDHRTTLILDMDFKAKIPYILPIFLKEYIPKVFNKL